MRMKTIGRDAVRVFPRPIVRWLAFFCVAVFPLYAQSFSTSPVDPLSTSGTPNAPSFHAVLTLDGPWRFQIGDDLRWAEPGFDD